MKKSSNGQLWKSKNAKTMGEKSMDIMNLIGGPILGILTAIVMTQRWALKQAKKEGVREEREKTQLAHVDAAHTKIRGVTMRVEELEKNQAKDEERHATFTKSQDTMAADIKAILQTVQNVLQSVSHLQGKVEGSSGK
jgi:hypothetical protein